MKRATKGITAAQLRLLLSSILVLLFLLGGGGFYFAQKLLRKYAQETSTLNSQAAISDQNLTALRNIQAYLATHTADTERAQRVVSDSKSYQYQNEIVSDITRFANQSGISITSYNFTPSGGATTATPSRPATTPTANVGTGSLKSTTVNVTIKSPVNYNNLLNFIARIEQNITKMQISGIALTRSEQGGRSQVSSESFNIEVFIR